MADHIPNDALELLSPQTIAHWHSSGERFGDDFPPELVESSPLVADWRSEGMSEIEIACSFARMLKLVREEQLGVIERVTLQDGSAVIYERDTRKSIPLIGRRRMQLTVRRLAEALCGVAIVAVVIGATTDTLDAWMPNIATSALSIALTITVVAQLLKREDRRRIQPRIKGSLRRLGRLIQDLAAVVSRDYDQTHSQRDRDLTTDPVAVFNGWLTDEDDIPRERSGETGSPLTTKVLEFALAAKRIGDADREVLPPDLVAAIDDLETTIVGAEEVRQLLLTKYDVDEFEAADATLGLAITGVLSLASTLEPLVDPTWSRAA